eukprot:m.167645 g.167645  ORF g.167645 m.167645 type:complete len:332 (-) comp13464_c2_seq17:2086-3081(-)
MSVNYYEVLNLKRDALPEDIRKAYRKLALEFHPDRNNELDAAKKFAAVAEAFTVLSTPKLKAIFDNYGSNGLKNGAPKGHDTYTEPWVFGDDAKKVFSDFFGTENPFQDIFPPQDEMKFGEKPHLSQQLRRVQSSAIVSELLITMEEAFGGCTKKLKISRKVLNEDGHTTTQRDKILTVHVKPGWKEGTKVTFPKEGDQGPNNIPADVVFVIKYKNHPRFTRKGNDLHHTADVKLADALCGCGISLLTLDGRDITIPVNDVITPSYTKRVEREGMPHSKNTKEKGDLILHFNLIFPRNLSQKQKQLVRAGLNNDNNNNNDNILYIVVNNCI